MPNNPPTVKTGEGAGPRQFVSIRPPGQSHRWFRWPNRDRLPRPRIVPVGPHTKSSPPLAAPVGRQSCLRHAALSAASPSVSREDDSASSGLHGRPRSASALSSAHRRCPNCCRHRCFPAVRRIQLRERKLRVVHPGLRHSRRTLHLLDRLQLHRAEHLGSHQLRPAACRSLPASRSSRGENPCPSTSARRLHLACEVRSACAHVNYCVLMASIRDADRVIANRRPLHCSSIERQWSCRSEPGRSDRTNRSRARRERHQRAGAAAGAVLTMAGAFLKGASISLPRWSPGAALRRTRRAARPARCREAQRATIRVAAPPDP
jgi:hypothetical protein